MNYIKREEVLMGRDAEFPLSLELEKNLQLLLACLNQFRTLYGIPMNVSSGYRPGHYNSDVGGAKHSNHVTCQACDFRDVDGELAFFCANRMDILEKCGLYLEMPSRTKGWVHLQIVCPSSGHRVFVP